MDAVTKKQIGAKIKELRVTAGHAQWQLASMLGTTQQAVGRWEAGQTLPDLDTFFRLCDIYHVQDILATFGYTVPTPAAVTTGLLRKLERLDSTDAALAEAYVDGLLSAEKYSPTKDAAAG